MTPPDPQRVTLNRQAEIAVLTIDRPPVNAGFRVILREVGQEPLDRGITRKSSDIDVIRVHGCRFPRDLGGPMFWDDQGRPDPARDEGRAAKVTG